MLLITFSFLGTVPVLIWLGIYFHGDRPWDFKPDDENPDPTPEPENWPAVQVLVPARNESESLPETLPHLLHQDYPGRFKVTLIDDRSSDGTADVARKIALNAGASDRLTVISGLDLPEGWVGKVWALEQGARALGVYETATDEQPCPWPYLLLTDADILHAPDSLRKLVMESEAGGLGLNSRMARLRCSSPPERLLIPAFVFFFNLLYPMRAVNDPRRNRAAAAGGCVLLSSEALRKSGGFQGVKGEIIDDVNLARQIKGLNVPIRLSLSVSQVISLRAYDTLSSVWKMVRRTAFTELGYSWLRLTGALVGLALLFLLPPLWLVMGLILCGAGAAGIIEVTWIGVAMVIAKGSLAWFLMARVYRPGVRFFDLPATWSWTLPFAGILYGCMTFDSALRHLSGTKRGWR